LLPSVEPSLDSESAPAGIATWAASSAAVAVAPRLFDRPLPFDPQQGQPGAAGLVRWAQLETWRRYITPIDIPPNSPRGQNGLDEHPHAH
jgi:hypothetical protein